MTGETEAAKDDEVTPTVNAAPTDKDGPRPSAAQGVNQGAPTLPVQPAAAPSPTPTPLPEMPKVRYPNAGFFAPLSSGLVTVVGLLPGLVSIPTVVLYLVLPLLSWTWNPGLVAVAAGSAIGVGAWIVLGVVFYWTADPARVSAGEYTDLESRYLMIEARLLALDKDTLKTQPQRAAYLQAVAMRDELQHMFDPTDKTTARISSHWISGAGYVSAWHRVHHAHEALMIIEQPSDVVQAALYDRDRLQGSRISGRDKTLNSSALAISTLDFSMKPVVGLKVDATPAPIDPDMARVVLSNIKNGVNEYRDGLRGSLVHLRRRTIQGLLFVGLTGYLVVAVALIMGAKKEAVVSAAAFYLSGAMIGLFHAAYLEQRRRVAVEDYGLYWNRLLLLPVIAGIAGLVGAGLTAFLTAPPLGLALIDKPDLLTFLNFEEYPMGLVAAAIFGLTPGLLLDRIKALGDEVKTDLVKSGASGNENSAGQDKSDNADKSDDADKSDNADKSDAANNNND